MAIRESLSRKIFSISPFAKVYLAKFLRFFKSRKFIQINSRVFGLAKVSPIKVIEFVIEEEKFANGAFRNAFKAVARNHPLQNWVIKQYTPMSVETMKEHLGLTPEDHTRKQVQMHTVARNVAQRFSKKAPPEFGPTFSYVS